MLRIELSESGVQKAVQIAIEKSIWFEVTPMPEEKFEIAVKDEGDNASIFQSLR